MRKPPFPPQNRAQRDSPYDDGLPAVWIQLEGLYGKIRLRLQLIADPPFVRHTTFTFPKLPSVSIAAKPMRGFNVVRALATAT